MNVLITGINGFKGSNLALHELKQGNAVIGIVRDKNAKTRSEIQSQCTIINGDICDFDLVNRVISDYEIDLIYHVAAQSIVRIANKNPMNCYHSNILGTINIMEAVRQVNIKIKVVCASSDKAYGTHDKLPYTEDMKLQPDDPYSTSKACADMIAQSYHKTYGLNINVIRCANIYGGGDMNLSRIIPNTIRQIKMGNKPQLYAGVVNYKREFIYIDDVCEAYQIIAKKGLKGEIYNIGDTEFFTIGDLVKKISKEMAYDGGIDVIGKNFLEIPFQYLSSKKLQGLGWRKKTSIDEGLKKTIEWYKSNI